MPVKLAGGAKMRTALPRAGALPQQAGATRRHVFQYSEFLPVHARRIGPLDSYQVGTQQSRLPAPLDAAALAAQSAFLCMSRIPWVYMVGSDDRSVA